MSGYFVHGGTQYPFSQSAQQSTPQTNVADLGYQQQQAQAQTSQFYQGTSYQAVQTSRAPLAVSKSSGTGFYGGSSFSNQTMNQGYTTTQRANPQTQTFSSVDGPGGSSNAAYSRQSPVGAYNRVGFNNASYGASSYGAAAKQEQKYPANTNYGGFKSSSVGGDLGGSLNSASTNYYTSQPSQQTNYNTSYPVNTSYNKQPAVEEASSSQYSYEKALYVAANQYYLSKKAAETGRGGRGGGGGTGGRGRGARGRGRGGNTSQFNQTAGPKVIKATEVKAYLYAWCGQRRLKPEYTIEPLGMPPKMKFSCQLHISGLDYIAKVEALSKKDAQSKAAWDFCEHLVKTGYMKQTELPPKPLDPTPRNIPPKPSTPAGTQPETADSPEESGGWSLENCRQRLNQFTQRWRIPAEFKHETLGPEHARIFVAELAIKVKFLNKDFVAKERGSNKKQATAVCALAMVRQLYKEGLIEKHGDPIKHPRRVRQEEEPKTVRKVEGGGNTAGTKRKADESTPSEEVDEFGNWTLEGARQRLHQFCQATGQPFEIKYTDDGNSPPKHFTASMSIEVTADEEKQKIERSHTCQGKKQAAQNVALEVIKELFQLGAVEANIGLQQNKKKNARQRSLMDISVMPTFDPGFGMGFGPPPGMFSMGGFSPFMGGGPTQRRTPYEDAIINEKHRRIYPSELELTLIQRSVRAVEAALKQVSDELAKPAETEENGKDVKIKQEASKIKQETGAEEEKTSEKDTKEPKRVLQGVMRVGILAKGLLLQGDLASHLVLLCSELPTVVLIKKISSLLTRIMEESNEKYLVELHASDCAINVISPAETDIEKDETKRCTVKISLTCPAMRTLADPAAGPADMLNRDKCIESLAELRHAKWFQACANGIPSCVVLLRIFRDMRKRISTWQPLSEWALELIVEKSLQTCFGSLSVGEGLRRVLSCLSSGILLEDGSGIYDPCEKEPTDVIRKMTPQEREDLSESAHHALRMLVFRQTHKILGIEPLPVRPRKGAGPHGTMDGESKMDISM